MQVLKNSKVLNTEKVIHRSYGGIFGTYIHTVLHCSTVYQYLYIDYNGGSLYSVPLICPDGKGGEGMYRVGGGEGGCTRGWGEGGKYI